MDINLLVVSVGNSRLQLASIVSGELDNIERLSIDAREDWPAAIERVWAKASGTGAAEIAGASVVPHLIEQVEHVIKRITGQDVQWVGRDLDLPIKVGTDEPAKTGVDRVVVCAAAWEQLEKACIVVDAGTALTINCVDEQGVLQGGAILPGARVMLESMKSSTAALPSVEFKLFATDEVGKNTADAMRLGVTAALRGAVQTVAEAWASEMGTWPEVIATGGDAETIFDGWEIVHATSPDLVLYGIGLAYTQHHIKHGS